VVALIASAAIGMSTIGVASAAPAQEPGAHSAMVPAAQRYYWEWSDGSQKAKRTFVETDYGSQAALPHVLVTAVPARPNHYIYLQYYQDGKWVLEDKAGLSSKGVATLDIDPYCDNGTWCDGTYKYRVKVGANYQILKITFSET
jgi:hypothetical protein